MSNAEIKSKIIQMVERLEEDALLQEVYELLETGGRPSANPIDIGWWNELSESQKKGLQEGVDALDRGEYVTYEEVRNGIKEKFNI